MPPIYSRYLKRALSDAVEQLCSAPLHEQLQLFEELALMRDAAGQSVAIFSIMRDLADTNPTDMSLRSAAADAASAMMSDLQQVVRVVDRAAAIQASAKDKISVHTLQHFVDQLVIVAHAVFGDDPRVEEFRQAIHERVKIPDGSNLGTTKLPSDDDIAAMDASVPLAPQ